MQTRRHNILIRVEQDEVSLTATFNNKLRCARHYRSHFQNNQNQDDYLYLYALSNGNDNKFVNLI